MNTILAEAKSQLDELERKRQGLLEIIAIAERLDDPAVSLSVAVSTKQAVDTAMRAANRPSVVVRRRPVVVSRPSVVMTETSDAVRAILSEHRAPLKLSELLEKVLARGIEVGGKDPASTLSARLSNSDEFVSHRGIGWWFQNQPIPEAPALIEESAGNLSTDHPSDSNTNEGDAHGAALADPRNMF